MFYQSFVSIDYYLSSERVRMQQFETAECQVLIIESLQYWSLDFIQLLLYFAQTCQPSCAGYSITVAASGFHERVSASLSAGGLSAGKIDIARMSVDPVSGLSVCPAAEPAEMHWYATRWRANGLRSVALVCRQFVLLRD